MSSTALKALPGSIGLIKNIQGIRKYGFLQFINELWTTHGDLFQIKLGSRLLVIPVHPEAVRHITITHRQNYDKLESYEPTRRYLLGNGLLTSIGEPWRMQRKLMAPFYTPRGVQAYAEIMMRDGRRLLQRWEKLADQNEPVAMDEEMTIVTAQIILKAMFSMETDDEIVSMKDSVETMIGYQSTRQSMPIPIPTWLPTQRNLRYRAARDQVHGYINGVIGQRRAMSEDQWPQDLLTKLMMVRNEETGTPLSESLLRDEAITTFFAGHETTARLLTFTWYALSSHPEVMATLQAELDRVLGSREATLEDLHHLPYTLQVIKEALRLYPPAPFYVRDAIESDVIDGYTIPETASMMLSPYYTHRHPEFWADPLKFDPDRWTPEKEAAMHPSAYHPFSSGQRVCIGNNFSLLESHILLALLAQKFTPRLQAGHEPQWIMQGTLGVKNGMPMTIERRR